MLVLILGGRNNGKTEFANTLPYNNKVFYLNKAVKDLFDKGEEDIIQKITGNLENKNITVICDEIGCGIVPLKKEDRDYRELVGRCSCEIAKKADEVYRVYASVGTRIK